MKNAPDVREETALIAERIKLAMVREPWGSLPEDQRIDHLPKLVEALLQTAFDEREDEKRTARVLELGRIHGLDRRYQGFDEEVVLAEYYLLRSEACDGLRTLHADDALESVIPKLDAAISSATMASLRGLHGRDVDGL